MVSIVALLSHGSTLTSTAADVTNDQRQMCCKTELGYESGLLWFFAVTVGSANTDLVWEYGRSRLECVALPTISGLGNAPICSKQQSHVVLLLNTIKLVISSAVPVDPHLNVVRQLGHSRNESSVHTVNPTSIGLESGATTIEFAVCKRIILQPASKEAFVSISRLKRNCSYIRKSIYLMYHLLDWRQHEDHTCR